MRQQTTNTNQNYSQLSHHGPLGYSVMRGIGMSIHERILYCTVHTVTFVTRPFILNNNMTIKKDCPEQHESNIILNMSYKNNTFTRFVV